MRGRIIAAAMAACLVTGCAVKPLKAPCARDDGPALVSMAYSSLSGAGEGECGPMKPVNGGSLEGRTSR